MFDNMRRLYPRGPENRGLAVDADGAMLGPDCVLVRRTAQGYRCISREEGAVLQEFLLGEAKQPDWLFEQCRRIHQALADNQVVLAQILGCTSRSSISTQPGCGSFRARPRSSGPISIPTSRGFQRGSRRAASGPATARPS